MSDDPELAAIRERKLAELQALKEATEAPDAEPEPEAGPAWPDAPVTVTDADFHEEVAKYPVALVDYWAAWCGPCRMLAPTLEEVAREMQGKAAVLKLNVDENPRTAQQFGIQSLPTMMVFKDGRPVDALVGALPKPQITTALRRHLGARRGTPGPRRV